MASNLIALPDPEQSDHLYVVTTSQTDDFVTASWALRRVIRRGTYDDVRAVLAELRHLRRLARKALSRVERIAA